MKKVLQALTMRRLYLFALFMFSFVQICAQHQEHDEHKEVHPAKLHKLTFVIANSLITNSVDNVNALLIVPTFGINYDYWWKERWGVGLHTDLVLQQFKVERHNDLSVLERENPVALCAMFSYEPSPRWIIMAGYGIELERNENINLFRVGLEYGIPLKDHWELGFNIEYDYKIKAYSSIMFGIVFSKLFFRKRHD